jgi:DNA-binding IclR family transcriptional regulator
MLEVIDKTFNILELFLQTREKISLPELAKMSGYNTTTTARIVNKLVERGYLNKCRNRKGYRLGSKVLEFRKMRVNRAELRNTIYPFLIKLSESVDETIAFLTWDELEITPITAIPSTHLLRVVPDEWAPTEVELYNNSSGKAILANMNDFELNTYLDSVPMKNYTPNSIMDVNDLKSQFTTIRQEGVAYNFEEHEIGVNSVASVVRDDTGNVIGSIAIIGPSSRLTRARLRQFAPLLKSISDKVSHLFGYQEKRR